jgi:hypothetical protein
VVTCRHGTCYAQLVSVERSSVDESNVDESNVDESNVDESSWIGECSNVDEHECSNVDERSNVDESSWIGDISLRDMSIKHCEISYLHFSYFYRLTIGTRPPIVKVQCQRSIPSTKLATRC